ncbi:helix-turn-helix transcriptional regulator [Thermoflavifilum thermophilum]|uniref:Regulatory protein, luxR family n=1 Tax=Thermoflavifilum thermophilum TaxID=1393122 RepID=A0A1I7N6V5_9BACT|nr:helix-turn-helix transcriptional regulator [Thermoflavifilum thermophilum]SFV30398.1 regulatory protein, luxR family [Thermoflavifilum thermophilum]
MSGGGFNVFQDDFVAQIHQKPIFSAQFIKTTLRKIPFQKYQQGFLLLLPLNLQVKPGKHKHYIIGMFFHEDNISLLIDDYRSKADLFSDITKREAEILSLLKLGYGYKEIASRIHISYNTVLKHMYNIRKKLKLNNLVSLLRIIHLPENHSIGNEETTR